jgi:AbiV family abortive infection protein
MHCFENAKSLLDDSMILFGSERYNRATTQSFGAIEVIGKIAILHEMAELPNNIDNNVLKDIWKKKWNNFNNHDYKKALGKQEIWTDKLALYGGISLDPMSKEMKYVDSYR